MVISKKEKTHKIKKINSKKKLFWIYLFILPSLIIFITFYLVPIITVFFTSFTKWDGFNSPQFVGIKNYIKLFKNDAFLISLKNLIAWSVLAMTVHVGFGTLVAFILYKKPFGWKFTRTVFMIPNVISVAAWAMIYKFFFHNDIGILNNLIRFVNPSFNVKWFYQSPYAFWAITLTWVFYAVVVTLIVLGDLMAIPSDIHEAAKIDGASSWQTTLKINLPLCRNAIGTGVICSVTARIAMYESIILTTAGGPGDDTMNIPVILVNSLLDYRYGYANTSGVIMFVIGMITLLIVNKVFRMNDSIY
ncbi:sugar ABC transporter permease [Vallitalea longa]|uniref:Sugar ABC transporter permease n=1 Tax=Vallitalea longa TaxID=2936439 RepID=A0A9W6DD59_9FIRM|nr:sugar ABC transporter permease [Vallitalea longa]GKX28231.1 sugar ABC transporter permease [Vallitalea longa]